MESGSSHRHWIGWEGWYLAFCWFNIFIGFRYFVKLVVPRLFWLAVIEATSPELCPCFFQVDLAPAILQCFRRRDRKTPPVPVSVSHHPTFPIPSIPATYPPTDSRDPDYGDTVTSRPYYNQPSPRTVIQGGAVAPNSSYRACTSLVSRATFV
jgi:hypothetical protein